MKLSEDMHFLAKGFGEPKVPHVKSGSGGMLLFACTPCGAKAEANVLILYF